MKWKFNARKADNLFESVHFQYKFLSDVEKKEGLREGNSVTYILQPIY